MSLFGLRRVDVIRTDYHQTERIGDLLEYNTAAPTGWRCPEDLDPGASARRALRHRGGAVGHELSVVLIDDLWQSEILVLASGT